MKTQRKLEKPAEKLGGNLQKSKQLRGNQEISTKSGNVSLVFDISYCLVETPTVTLWVNHSSHYLFANRTYTMQVRQESGCVERLLQKLLSGDKTGRFKFEYTTRFMLLDGLT